MVCYNPRWIKQCTFFRVCIDVGIHKWGLFWHSNNHPDSHSDEHKIISQCGQLRVINDSFN